jgi:hypothetical protein
MKRKKLLNKLVGFLDMEEHKQRKHHDELKVLLKKLKKKKVELENKMLLENNDRKRKRLGKELEIIKAQREKGLKALQDLLKS